MRWSASAPLLLALAAAPQASPAASAPKPAAQREVLPFIEDDWPKALADARAKNVPIFIEAWAPW